MGDPKSTTQRPGGVNTGMSPRGDPGDRDEGAELGASERATRGTDRDLDRSGESKNQGRGHPREERGDG